MENDTPTFLDHELLIPNFAQDFRRFMDMPEDIFRALQENLGSVPSGQLPGRRQASMLSQHGGISLEDAVGHIRLLSYLFNNSQSIGLTPEEVVEHLEAASAQIGETAEISIEKREVLIAIFASQANTPSQPAPTIPAVRTDYVAVEGKWLFAPVEREDEPATALPVISLRFVWQEVTGEVNSVSLLVGEEVWEHLHKTVTDIQEARATLESSYPGLLSGQLTKEA